MSDDDEETAYATFDPTRHRASQEASVVMKLMDFVEASLAARLDSVEGLISKNKRELAKVQQELTKSEKVVNAYSNSANTNRLSDEIRLLFALARTDRLDLVGKVSTTSQPKPVAPRTPLASRSRSPIVIASQPETRRSYHNQKK